VTGRAAGTRAAAVLIAAALVPAVSGCGSVYIGSEESDPSTEPLRCDQPADQPSGMQVLLAQSVPAASAVPCLRAEAGDWVVSGLDIQDGRGRIELSHRYGDQDTATIELTAGCDVHGAREVTSQLDGVRRYDRERTEAGRYANETYYVYHGACTWLHFSLADIGRAELRAAEVAGALGFVSREHIDRQIRAASDDELHLDP
jgi:hypothetical protein